MKYVAPGDPRGRQDHGERPEIKIAERRQSQVDHQVAQEQEQEAKTGRVEGTIKDDLIHRGHQIEQKVEHQMAQQ